jgi:hypothetical protein
MVLGETKVNLVLATSTLAGIINQSSNQIRRNTTLFSLAQWRSINLCYPSYEVIWYRASDLQIRVVKSLVKRLSDLLHRAKCGLCIKPGVCVEDSPRPFTLAVAQKGFLYWLNALDSYPHLNPKHSRSQLFRGDSSTSHFITVDTNFAPRPPPTWRTGGKGALASLTGETSRAGNRTIPHSDPLRGIMILVFLSFFWEISKRPPFL